MPEQRCIGRQCPVSRHQPKIAGVWTFGVISLAAVVNQIAIALCRRAQVAAERDLDE
jgi:hypothetical protein